MRLPVPNKSVRMWVLWDPLRALSEMLRHACTVHPNVCAAPPKAARTHVCVRDCHRHPTGRQEIYLETSLRSPVFHTHPNYLSGFSEGGNGKVKMSISLSSRLEKGKLVLTTVPGTKLAKAFCSLSLSLSLSMSLSLSIHTHTISPSLCTSLYQTSQNVIITVCLSIS